MFLTIVELDNGRYILRNVLTGIVISRNGVARTFKSRKKAQKYIDKSMAGFNKLMSQLTLPVPRKPQI